MVRNIVNSARKVRPYVFMIAYTLVLSDLLNLAQEVAQEFVLSRFFPKKKVEINESYYKIFILREELPVEQTSEFENDSANVPDIQMNGNSSQSNVESYQVVN